MSELNHQHNKRVTAFTIAIARAMGISTEQMRGIARGALLQNIGEMGIEELLRKPGKLTSDEIALMGDHCCRGYQKLKRVPAMTEAAELSTHIMSGTTALDILAG